MLSAAEFAATLTLFNTTYDLIAQLSHSMFVQTDDTDTTQADVTDTTQADVTLTTFSLITLSDFKDTHLSIDCDYCCDDQNTC